MRIFSIFMFTPDVSLDDFLSFSLKRTLVSCESKQPLLASAIVMPESAYYDSADLKVCSSLEVFIVLAVMIACQKRSDY